MCQFIESIRLKNGELFNLELHQKRVEKTFLEFFPNSNAFDIKTTLQNIQLPDNELYKIRIFYDSEIRILEILEYQKPHFSKYKCFHIPSDFNYDFKFANRQIFDQISKNTSKDTLAILVKNGLVCDSTFSNLIFEKSEKLFSPAKALLLGTQLQKLISERKIQLIDIAENQIKDFDKIYFVNALNPLDAASAILL